MTFNQDGQGSNVEPVRSLGGDVSIGANGKYTQTASEVTASAGFAAETKPAPAI
jgi:hypothetical protein